MIQAKAPALPPKGLADAPTAVVIALMAAGFPALVWGQAQGLHPAWAVLGGTALMNLSFTAWHESAHGNFSRVRGVNTFAGLLASFLSVYPGYYARRREHLIHHRYEGVPGKDPVLPRVQGTGFWSFPWALFKANFTGAAPLDVPSDFIPLTPAQKAADTVSNLAALGLCVTAAAAGWGWAVFFAWILPRALVFWLHAFYICFFPHSDGAGGYKVHQIRRSGLFVRLLTVEQNLHGIHHLWPAIPWHRYRFYTDLFEAAEKAPSERAAEKAAA